MKDIGPMNAGMTSSMQKGWGHDHVCRSCGGSLQDVLDLGMSPLCESFVPDSKLDAMEAFFPLRLAICEGCFLLQLKEYASPEEIFSEYAYFSSYSDAYVGHARAYTDMIIDRLRLSRDSRVVELASNDGYLLQHFVERGIPSLGIEPAENVARAAIAKGVPTNIAFFGRKLAAEMAAQGKKADLIIGNNVLAQVPDLNDFIGGMRLLLAAGGVVTIEVPHLQVLIEDGLYDTIYHEHFSYFSLGNAEIAFARQGLRIFDVEEIWTHGGSLRFYICHAEDAAHPPSDALAMIRTREAEAGLSLLPTYRAFAEKCRSAKRDLLEFLITAKRAGKSIVAYGAPGKSATLLNYCGIRTDFIDYAVDRNPYKHGRYTPGTHIPIHPPEKIAMTRPDYVLILAWNLKDEIIEQMAHIRSWGGRFVVPMPSVHIE